MINFILSNNEKMSYYNKTTYYSQFIAQTSIKKLKGKIYKLSTTLYFWFSL